jgi:hypothetical protein
MFKASPSKKLLRFIPTRKLDGVAHACNSIYAGGRDRRIAQVGDWPHPRPYLKNK